MTCEKHYWYHGPLVDCPHCETDRLRAELEDKNKLLDSCSMQLNETANERNSLRAELDKFKAFPNVDMLRLCMIDVADENDRLKSELAKAQEENEKLRCRNKAQHAEIKATTAYSRGQDKALVLQQARIKELESNLEFAYKRAKVLADMLGVPVFESHSVTGTILGTVRAAVEVLQQENARLQSSLSEQYRKGMEEAMVIADKFVGNDGACKAIRARIKELEKKP